MSEQGQVRVSDPKVMRALAHPARIEILDYLNNSGADVTATECARMVGLSPSATSYHLRELAKYGLVEQAPSRGDGRERVWRSPGTGFSVGSEAGDDETVAAMRAVVDLFLAREFERARKAFGSVLAQEPVWQKVSNLSAMQLLLTAEELAEVTAKVHALFDPYRIRDRQESAPADARTVYMTYMAYPEVPVAEA